MLGDARRAFESHVAFTRLALPRVDHVIGGAEVAAVGLAQATSHREVAPIHALFVVPSGANGSRDWFESPRPFDSLSGAGFELKRLGWQTRAP